MEQQRVWRIEDTSGFKSSLYLDKKTADCVFKYAKGKYEEKNPKLKCYLMTLQSEEELCKRKRYSNELKGEMK